MMKSRMFFIQSDEDGYIRRELPLPERLNIDEVQEWLKTNTKPGVQYQVRSLREPFSVRGYDFVYYVKLSDCMLWDTCYMQELDLASLPIYEKVNYRYDYE